MASILKTATLTMGTRCLKRFVGIAVQHVGYLVRYSPSWYVNATVVGECPVHRIHWHRARLKF